MKNASVIVHATRLPNATGHHGAPPAERLSSETPAR